MSDTNCQWKGGDRGGQFTLGKSEIDGIIFPNVATWTNLFHKHSLIHGVEVGWSPLYQSRFPSKHPNDFLVYIRIMQGRSSRCMHQKLNCSDQSEYIPIRKNPIVCRVNLRALWQSKMRCFVSCLLFLVFLSLLCFPWLCSLERSPIQRWCSKRRRRREMSLVTTAYDWVGRTNGNTNFKCTYKDPRVMVSITLNHKHFFIKSN